MRRTPAVVIALFMIVISVVVLVVAWAGHDRSDRLNALEQSNRQMRVELDETKRELAQALKDLAEAQADARAAEIRAATAEARADRLQARVDALEAAMRARGIDPGTVVVPARSPAPDRTSARPSPTARPSASANPRPSPAPTCRVYNPITGRCLTSERTRP